MASVNKFPEVSDDAFREIFQSMSEGIIMVDENGRIKIANPVAEQVFGYTNNELVGMTMDRRDDGHSPSCSATE